MLLRVTVPKRTGRKRKRGSQDPYVDDPAIQPTASFSPTGSLDARQLIRRLRDNVGRYETEVVGRIERTHVFRGKPLLRQQSISFYHADYRYRHTRFCIFHHRKSLYDQVSREYPTI